MLDHSDPSKYSALATPRGEDSTTNANFFTDDSRCIATDVKVYGLVHNYLITADDTEISEADWVAAVRKSWSGALTIVRDGLVAPIGVGFAQEEETA